jgi:hypothetical protein
MGVRTSFPRFLVCLLLGGGVAACGSPDPARTSAPADSAASTPVVSSASPDASRPGTSATSATEATTKAPPSSSPAPRAGQAFPFTLTRTGGFIGAADRVTVAADGTATMTRRGSSPVQVKLSSTDLARLRSLLLDPALTREARQVRTTGVCNDGFRYSVRTPTLSMTWDTCDKKARPTADQILTLIVPLVNR